LTAANFKRARARAERGAPPAVSHQPSAIAYRQAPAARQAPPVAAEEGIKAMELLDRAIAAKGGLEKLRGIKTIVARQTLTSETPEGKKTAESTNYIAYPDKFRIETKGADPLSGFVDPRGTTTQGFDGRFGWMKDRAGLHAVSDAFVRDARLNLRREIVALLLAAKDGALTVRLLPDVRDALGKTNHAIELSARDLNPIVLQIDPNSSLVLKQTFVADTAGRPTIEEEFSDYRAVDGVQIPYHATRRTGAFVVDRRVTSLTINQPIDPALFTRPAS
jgi:hypothetical protein